MQSSPSTSLVHNVTNSRGGRRFSLADHARLEAFNIEIEKVQQRVTALIAYASPEQSEAIAEISWALMTNRPVTIPEDAPKDLHKLARLFRARRRVFPNPLPWRPVTIARTNTAMRRQRARPVAAPRERREGSSSRSSGQDPGNDDPDPDDGLALGFVDRAPFLWRFRHLRCRLLEIREGVER